MPTDLPLDRTAWNKQTRMPGVLICFLVLCIRFSFFLLGFMSSLSQLAWDKMLCYVCC
jgi:hypothetical protein